MAVIKTRFKESEVEDLSYGRKPLNKFVSDNKVSPEEMKDLEKILFDGEEFETVEAALKEEAVAEANPEETPVAEPQKPEVKTEVREERKPSWKDLELKAKSDKLNQANQKLASLSKLLESSKGKEDVVEEIKSLKEMMAEVVKDSIEEKTRFVHSQNLENTFSEIEQLQQEFPDLKTSVPVRELDTEWITFQAEHGAEQATKYLNDAAFRKTMEDQGNGLSKSYWDNINKYVLISNANASKKGTQTTPGHANLKMAYLSMPSPKGGGKTVLDDMLSDSRKQGATAVVNKLATTNKNPTLLTNKSKKLDNSVVWSKQAMAELGAKGTARPLTQAEQDLYRQYYQKLNEGTLT